MTLDPTLPPEIALKKALDDERARVMDLFRDMDTNEYDGVISKNEFIIGLLQMGLPGGDLAAELFDSWDVDKSGTIEYVELSKAIRRGIRLRSQRSSRRRPSLTRPLVYSTRRARKPHTRPPSKRTSPTPTCLRRLPCARRSMPQLRA